MYPWKMLKLCWQKKKLTTVVDMNLNLKTWHLQELMKLKQMIKILIIQLLQEMNTMRLERLQEHSISDPVWEREYNTDEYTGEVIE